MYSSSLVGSSDFRSFLYTYLCLASSLGFSGGGGPVEYNRGRGSRYAATDGAGALLGILALWTAILEDVRNDVSASRATCRDEGRSKVVMAEAVRGLSPGKLGREVGGEFGWGGRVRPHAIYVWYDAALSHGRRRILSGPDANARVCPCDISVSLSEVVVACPSRTVEVVAQVASCLFCA